MLQCALRTRCYCVYVRRTDCRQILREKVKVFFFFFQEFFTFFGLQIIILARAQFHMHPKVLKSGEIKMNRNRFRA
jgi:hypothetical protein